MKQINEFLDTYKDLGVCLDQIDIDTLTIKQLTKTETDLLYNLELKLSIK